jgi:thiamine-monophosphate kinase
MSAPAQTGSVSEFALIRRFFSSVGASREDVLIGVGDDCALLEVPPGLGLAVSLDTLVEGTHFFPDVDPESLGHKSLAVGLSDLAAMGATPAWATLSLTLPHPDETWLGAFARGFSALALAYGVRLVGGDMTRGPLSVSVQVHGFVRPGAAIPRSGARPDDLIWVSGTLGDAGLALRRLAAGEALEPGLRARLERPIPRVELGSALRGLATAMIDLSDGLAGDLGHILRASSVGAEVDLAALPLSPPVAAVVEADRDWGLPLTSGDDYELCFCTTAEQEPLIAALGRALNCPLAVVGQIRAAPGLVTRAPTGETNAVAARGYDHFPDET